MADGNSLPAYSSSDRYRDATNTKFAQRRTVGSELVGDDGGWSDALLLHKFPHELECRLTVAPWLLGTAQRSDPGVATVAGNNPRKSAPRQKIHQLGQGVLPMFTGDSSE